jgi:hypothetical protein
LQAAGAGPILGIDFLRKFKVTVVPEINQIQFACTAAASPAPCLSSAALPAPYLRSAASSVLPALPTLPPVPALVVIQPPAATSSSQPPAISTHVVWNPEVKSSSFSLRENQSLLDPPPSLQKIPDSVPADVTNLLQKFHYILRTGDGNQHQPMGLSITSTLAAIPLFLQNPAASIRKNCKLPKRSSKRLESAGIIFRSKSPWASTLHMVPKKTDRGGLVAITAVSIW